MKLNALILAILVASRASAQTRTTEIGSLREDYSEATLRVHAGAAASGPFVELSVREPKSGLAIRLGLVEIDSLIRATEAALRTPASFQRGDILNNVLYTAADSVGPHLEVRWYAWTKHTQLLFTLDSQDRVARKTVLVPDAEKCVALLRKAVMTARDMTEP